MRGRWFLIFGAAGALFGCPLYEDGCDDRHDCASGFQCDRFSRRCEPIVEPLGCTRPEACLDGETCTPDFVCRPGSCVYHGCVGGYVCGLADGIHTCLPAGDAGGDAAPPEAGPPGPADASPPPGDASLGDASAPDAAPSDASTVDADASP